MSCSGSSDFISFSNKPNEWILLYLVGTASSYKFGTYYHGGSFSPTSVTQACSLSLASKVEVGAFHGVVKRLAIYLDTALSETQSPSLGNAMTCKSE